MRANGWLIVWLCTLALWTPGAFARVQRDLLTVTGGQGQPTRWTLADWLRDVNGPALAASLLPLDRNSRLVQVNVGAGHARVNVNDGTTGLGSRVSREVQTLDADVYFSILNAHVETELQPGARDTRAAALGLRVLGTSARTTSLVVRFGWQDERQLNVHPNVTTARRYLEGRGQLYLWSWFGADASYRRYEAAGYRYEAGGFAEIGPARVTAGYQREVVGDHEQDGLSGAVKFFF